VRGRGVDLRLTPTVAEDGRILCDAEGFVAGVDMAGVWPDVVGSTGGGGGSIVDRLSLGLESRDERFGREGEDLEPVERKRPSSSSMGIGMEGFESFLRVEVRPNMSSTLTGCVSRSESASSKSKSGGTKDFLRKGEGVRVCELYRRKGRGEVIGGGVL
jgi:hypothetical protein